MHLLVLFPFESTSGTLSVAEWEERVAIDSEGQDATRLSAAATTATAASA